MALNTKYSFKDSMRGLLVHESVAGNTSDLDSGTIPDGLKSDLAGTAPVSPSATISTIRPNNKWEIQNGAKKLIVHKDKEFHEPAKLRIYREDFTLETDLTPGTEIVGTCFYCESALGDTGDPYKVIFPAAMTGVIFKRCNLDNVYIPPGNTITEDAGISSSHRRIRVQNDLEDWIVDATGNPIEPVNLAAAIEEGKNTDPKNIPASPIEVSL